MRCERQRPPADLLTRQGQRLNREIAPGQRRPDSSGQGNELDQRHKNERTAEDEGPPARAINWAHTPQRDEENGYRNEL